MRFVLFYHSLISDWNHASAHALRGVATELLDLGHCISILEPENGWSLHNLLEQGGQGMVKAFHATYPRLRSSFYDPEHIDLDEALADADVVIAHEWTDAGLLRRLGQHRARARSYKLLFHDAPQWSIRQPVQLRGQVLSEYDGVLASSEGLRGLYEERDWAARVWTWRDAVDTRIFQPGRPNLGHSLDLIWIGSWGSGERASELNECLIDPIRALGLRARFYGARYPEEALRALRASGIDYGGWIPDFGIPAAFASGRFTVHVPRRMHGDGLPHAPATRVLQALACGIPVVTTRWDECEQMFTPGVDLLIGRDGHEAQRHLIELRNDAAFSESMAANGCATVISRHSCAVRVTELLAICRRLGAGAPRPKDDLPQPPAGARRAGGGGRSHAPAAWS
ncbi:MAG TPA: glycosyltransferase [Steroidobacteraceae bacterium]|nr:glycosyltransferase [Steroidobacteraceae bacterium]